MLGLETSHNFWQVQIHGKCLTNTSYYYYEVLWGHKDAWDRPQPSVMRMRIRITAASRHCQVKYHTDIIEPVLDIIHPRGAVVGKD